MSSNDAPETPDAANTTIAMAGIAVVIGVIAMLGVMLAFRAHSMQEKEAAYAKAGADAEAEAAAEAARQKSAAAPAAADPQAPTPPPPAVAASPAPPPPAQAVPPQAAKTVPPGPVTSAKGAPDWVARGSIFVDGEYGRALYAVGSSAKGPEYRTMMAQARDAAKAELTRGLADHVQLKLAHFRAAAGQTVDMQAEDRRAFLARIAEDVIPPMLAGREQVATWKSGEGTLYVLMRLTADDINRLYRDAFIRSLSTDEAKALFQLNDEAAQKAMERLVDESSLVEPPVQAQP